MCPSQKWGREGKPLFDRLAPPMPPVIEKVGGFGIAAWQNAQALAAKSRTTRVGPPANKVSSRTGSRSSVKAPVLESRTFVGRFGPGVIWVAGGSMSIGMAEPPDDPVSLPYSMNPFGSAVTVPGTGFCPKNGRDAAEGGVTPSLGTVVLRSTPRPRQPVEAMVAARNTVTSRIRRFFRSSSAPA